MANMANMATDSPDNTDMGIITGLKPKEIEILSMVMLCSPPKAQATCLANVDFDKFASMGKFKSAHAAKTLGRNSHQEAQPTQGNADAPTPNSPKKRKLLGKRATTTPDPAAEHSNPASPVKKPRGRPKKSAAPASAPAHKDGDEVKESASEHVAGQADFKAE